MTCIVLTQIGTYNDFLHVGFQVYFITFNPDYEKTFKMNKTTVTRN